MASERPTILVVEDDATLVLGLEINLRAEGFRVLSARDGQTGLRMGLEQNPDLAVLDLGLPGMDGLDVLAEWRRRGRELPVIVLTARATLDDKVLGLGQGADDYLTKPFRIKELTARIRAALRRAGLGRGPRRVPLGEVEVDLDARKVSRAGAEMALTAKEFDLLAFLIERPGRVFSRERLLEAVWGMDYDGTDRTVDNFVRSLRVKVEADPAEPRHVVTVRGAGYRFEA
jgi:two-component system alkaline phosphatase synthesis response regulator PhoP